MSVTLSREMSIEDIRKILKQLPSGKKLNATKHLGVIQLREDPLLFQKKMRDEWWKNFVGYQHRTLLFGWRRYFGGSIDQKEVFLSIISEMEMLGYPSITDNEVERIKIFIGDCNVLELTNAVKAKAIFIRREYNVKLPDAIIAVTAIQANIPFISSDAIFKRISELHFIEYKF